MKKYVFALIVLTALICAGCQLELAEAPTYNRPEGIVPANTPVVLETTVKNAVIRYTIDGTDPTFESTLYGSAINIVKNTILKAAAFKGKKKVSEVAMMQYYVQAATPESNVESGTYGTSQTITLSSTTTGVAIHYTLDGTTPTASSPVYSGAIALSSFVVEEKTLKMIACSDDYASSDVATYTYILYTPGPAGGYVFYDCDADNNAVNNGAGLDNLKSSDCGWRYLEAAPADITVGATIGFVAGYYRTSDNGDNLYVNGSTFVEGTVDPDDGKSTGTEMGTGKANTAKLVEKMGSAAYIQTSGSDTTADYAAKLCDDYTYGGYSDWFLPSMAELMQIYRKLKLNGLGGLTSECYWSSSEDLSNANYIWYHYFYNGFQIHNYRGATYRVRAIRAYLPTEE